MQAEIVKKIVIGQSTENDVQALLGRPQQIQTSLDQTGAATLWVYQYVRRGTYELVPALREQLSKPALHSILTVHFDQAHFVQKVERMDQEIRTPEEGGVLVPF
jgi:hypothetical protein